MFGNVVIYLAFAAVLGSAILFFVSAHTKNQKANQIEDIAIYAAYLHAFAVFIASAFLLYLLFTHQFQYAYVYNHTDLHLKLHYLISAFWAGQEGSYLFWTLCGAIVGLFVLENEQKLRSAVMTVFMAGQAFLILMLILDSPFRILDWLPADGSGMNPLLMDIWMVVHPPIIFAGYALLLVPYSYALAALYHKDYREGLIRCQFWVLIGWLLLGTGILIGGVWAYRVLGWGGYWGWDPVENASLIPWLTASALVHGLILQKQKDKFIRSNLLLAISTYLLVILATFLTRSGVMSAYSVHAFAENELTYVLTSYLLLFSLLAGILFAWRYNDMGKDKSFIISPFSRSGSFSLSMIIFCMIAALVLLGTISPLLTGIFGNPAMVDSSFYTSVNAPLFFVILLLLGLIEMIWWKKSNSFQISRYFLFALLTAVIAGLGAYFAGVKSITDLLYLGACGFALFTNIILLIKVWLRSGLKFSGAYLAHVGIILMLAGILVSTNYTRSILIELTQNQPVDIFSHTFTYQGYALENNNSYVLNIELNRANKTNLVQPKIETSGKTLIKQPAILRNWWRDIYISPQEVIFDKPGSTFELTKGDTFNYNNYQILFRDLEVNHNYDQITDSVEIGAILEVYKNNEMEIIIPFLKMEGNTQYREGVTLPGSKEKIFLNNVDPSQGTVQLGFDSESFTTVEVLIAEIKFKPFISVLGLGALLLIIGIALAVWRRLISNPQNKKMLDRKRK